MAVNFQGTAGGVLGLTNAAAGTVYYGVIPGRVGTITRVLQFQVQSATTANSVYWMRPIGRANTSQAQTTSDSSVVLDADPSPTGNTIAAGDQCILAFADGTYQRMQVNTSGWNSTTKTLTFTATLPAAVSKGAKFWMFGVYNDTDPATNAVFPQFITTANTTTTYQMLAGGIRGVQTQDPLLIYCPNATNATNTNFVEYTHTAE